MGQARESGTVPSRRFVSFGQSIGSKWRRWDLLAAHQPHRVANAVLFGQYHLHEQRIKPPPRKACGELLHESGLYGQIIAHDHGGSDTMRRTLAGKRRFATSRAKWWSSLTGTATMQAISTAAQRAASGFAGGSCCQAGQRFTSPKARSSPTRRTARENA